MGTVLLLSGGLDSAVLLALLAPSDRVVCLSVDYGQRHAAELGCASRIAAFYDVPHHVVRVSMSFLSTPLTMENELECRTLEQIRADDESAMIVPARNAIFASLGISLAEQEGCDTVALASNSDDSAFFDCRPAFFDAMTAVSEAGTATGPKVVAPLVKNSKAWIAKESVRRGVPVELTSSCYQPGEATARGGLVQCGRCDACVIRLDAFEACGLPDSAEYRVKL